MTLHSALSMSRLSADGVDSPDADVARVVRQVLDGDVAAFEQIVCRYEHRVIGLAARLLGTRDDACDAAQEVFLRAFKYLHRLDVGKPIEPWLLRITVNVCRDAARRRQRRRDTLVEGQHLEAVDESPDPPTDLARKQERLILQRALKSLPPKERLAIMLRDVEGLSTSEVADILRSSDTTVRSQISRGRLRLKAAVDALVKRTQGTS